MTCCSSCANPHERTSPSLYPFPRLVPTSTPTTLLPSSHHHHRHRHDPPQVGVRSLEDAAAARRSGADSLLVKAELLHAHADNVQLLGQQLQYAVTLDD